MNKYVADTNSLFWYLTNSPRLSANVSAAYDEADDGSAIIYIPAIVLAELYYLNVKQGSPIDFAQTVDDLLNASQFILLPFNPLDVLEFDACSAVPEMHDRIIAAVAKRLNVPCLTSDVAIRQSGLITVIW